MSDLEKEAIESVNEPSKELSQSIEEDSKQEPEEEKKKRFKYGWLIELLIYVLLVVFCFTIMPRYVLQRTIVDGDSMNDTLKGGQNLWTEKVSYRFKDPSRFDIIVLYPNGRDHDEYYVKRVIGLPGETIQITNNTIYINGKVLKENYGKNAMDTGGIAEKPLKLKDDEFFVLGDNRQISEDSRYEEVGPIKREKIDGHAFWRLYPFKDFGPID